MGKRLNKKIAFILYLYPFGVSTMIVNSIKMFADKGFDVDIYIDKANKESYPAVFKRQNIRFFEYVEKKSAIRTVLLTIHSFYKTCYLRILRKFSLVVGDYRSFIPSPFFFIYYIHDYFFLRWLKRTVCKDYDYIFPVETKSLIAASGIKANIIYYNMELLDWSVANPIYGIDKILLKILEYKALRRVTAAVIQNETRAEQFRKINNFQKPIYILPVASIGEPVRGKGSFFRDKFGIPGSKQVVIYSGNIMPWAKCLEIVDTVKHWPNDYCLVLHTWKKGAFANGYGLRVKKRAKGFSVYFSDDYLDIDKLAGNMSSADIGLMFYEAIDTNFVEILFSSNKLGEYLKAGLPIITFDYPELRRFCLEKGIGKTVQNIEQLPQALVEIVKDYDSYKRRVSDCYESIFRFEKYFDALFQQLYGNVSYTGNENQLIQKERDNG